MTFEHTGAAQDWTVPYGVTSATFEVFGAAGRGFDCEVGCRFKPGKGGWAKATISVTPQSTVRVMVGGIGLPNSGGFNGGGNAPNGGGGASDIRIGGTTLADRVLVAGGGGGTGGCADQLTSPFGGSGSGQNGWAGQSSCGEDGGGGGTQTAGGSSFMGGAGSLGQGGSNSRGGGGGGGYYGGGSGGSANQVGGAGGGGSGFGPPGYLWDSSRSAGDGSASITYEVTERQTLFASATGPGSGWISTSPAGLDCGTDDIVSGHGVCSFEFGEDLPVTITANPSPGSVFTSWATGTGGPCQGSTQPICNTTMAASRIVSASFANGPRELTVSRSGNGSGNVTSNPAGIECGATCDFDFVFGTSVTLTANPATGSDFTGWTGACSGTSTCTVAMDQVRNVDAEFTLQKRTLTLAKFEDGSGSVTSSPAGIDFPTGAIPCGLNGSCVYAEFEYGTVVTLTPAAATGSDFIDWGGVCQPVNHDQNCTITMDQDRYAEVEFKLQERNLTVQKTGSGVGTVTSAPSGIDCGNDCGNAYLYGTQITLTAAPGANTLFAGWSGDDGNCSDSSTTCVVTMDQARTIAVAFPLEQRTVSVTKAGNGSGTVTSEPAGIDCGGQCSASFDIDSTVTLVADPATGSDFAGWTGACSGTGSCTLTTSQARDAEATFVLEKHLLQVTPAGNGSGQVTSEPAGIECGAVCKGEYDHGTVVTLTAMPAAGSTFLGWSGGCSGAAGTCAVHMDETRSVSAEFGDLPPRITRLKVVRKKSARRLRAKIKIGLTEAATVRFRLKPLSRRGKAFTFTHRLKGGTSSRVVRPSILRKLKPGRYRLTAIATDSAGQTSKKRQTTFKRPRVKGTRG